MCWINLYSHFPIWALEERDRLITPHFTLQTPFIFDVLSHNMLIQTPGISSFYVTTGTRKQIFLISHRLQCGNWKEILEG